MATTVIIAVGIDENGDLINLYTGPSYADGEKAIYEAGREGLIAEGMLFNNPQPVLNQYYTIRHKSEKTFSPELFKRPRGRPRKEVTV